MLMMPNSIVIMPGEAVEVLRHCIEANGSMVCVSRFFYFVLS